MQPFTHQAEQDQRIGLTSAAIQLTRHLQRALGIDQPLGQIVGQMAQPRP